MNLKAPHTWPAQSPRADFADRAVAAIVRDGALRRAAARPRRLLGAMAIAAVLVAGGAWARVSLPRAPRAQATLPSAGPTASSATKTPAAEHASAAPEPARNPPRPQAPPPTPSLKRSPVPAAAPDAGRRVRVPMCNCAQAICDCGEEP
jgi:hypothetical protein